jgi:hypothetical protein
MKVQPTYKLLGYKTQPPVPLPSHLPLEKDRALRVGGEDEYALPCPAVTQPDIARRFPVRGPRGTAAAAAVALPTTLPPAFLLPPATPTPAAIAYDL